MKFDRCDYELQMASSLLNDGVLLELIAGSPDSGEIVADVLYSDADGSVRFTQYRRDVPEAALDWLRAEAARRLPPLERQDPP